VVGHVLAASGTLGAGSVLAVAPLAVLPARQGRGIGARLMSQLLEEAETAGWRAVVLLGSPSYYERFGFEPAGRFGVTYPPVGPDHPHFLIRRLRGFDGSHGGEFRYCWE
jgi:predicted N-acetyltransferase YhbS